MTTHRFTIEQIREEAEYMLCEEISIEEAQEIQFFADYNKGASLEEIIQDYFECVR